MRRFFSERITLLKLTEHKRHRACMKNLPADKIALHF
jgi:hypothetical protein